MWENIDISGVGRPNLVPNEKSILVESNVGIYQGKYKATGYQDGRLYLTTHRICYVDNANPRTNSIALDLAMVKDMEYYGGFLKSSPKITLFLSENKPSESITPTQRQTVGATWVCQICYFSNVLKYDYEELPKCLTCGIQADQSQIDEALAAASKAPSPKPTDLQLLNKKNKSEGFPCPRCTFNNHPLLTQCEMCGERLLSPRLPPELASIRSDSPGPSLPLVPGSDGNITKLSFRGSGVKKFYDELKTVLKTQPWLKDSAPSSVGSLAHGNKEQRPASRGPGLHGLEQANEQDRQKTEQVLGGALEDLSSLMDRAKEVIKLAESYALHLEKEEQKDSSLAARRALRQSSEALGLKSNIVTKEMSHDQELFHQELARQIAEFLDSGSVLSQEGGVISLVDLFAIYNRARGISLISPKDLHAACSQFERLKLPIRLRKFKSGLLVVQESYRTPRVIIRNLLNWIRSLDHDEGISAHEASSKFGWSVTVAVEELEMAEQHGAICRDEQLSGTRFFENQIVPYVEVKQ